MSDDKQNQSLDPDNVYKTLLESTKAIPWKIDWATLQARADALEPGYQLGLPRFVESLRRMNRHDEKQLII